MHRFVLACLLALTLSHALHADDSPQFRGPNRDGISKETGLLKTWGKDEPAKVWSVKGLGLGFGTPSVASGMIFGMGTRDGKDGVWALKESDGSELWFVDIDTPKNPNQNNGPSGTPTFHDGKLYAISSKGKLVCLEAKTGKSVWQADLVKDFGGQVQSWGYTESPLIDGDKLICTPGKKNTLIALNKNSGEVIWRSAVPGGDGAGYASVMPAEIAGQRQYIQFLQGGLVSVGASDGEFLWRYNGSANGTANCSMALVSENRVFSASNYGKGGGLVEVTKSGSSFEAKETYFDKPMQNHHGGMVLVDGYIYGTGGGSLRCIEFKTGKLAWDERTPGKGSVTYADGHIYCRHEGSGKVFLVEANPKEYVQKGQLTQPDRSKTNAWAYPVIANGKLYLRDQESLHCYDIKAK